MNKLKKDSLSMFSILLLLAVVVLALAGCGGGAGGQNKNSSNNTNTNSQQDVAGTLKAIGLVAFTDTGVAAGASVTVKSYNPSGNEVDSINGTTDDTGKFASSVKMADSGGFIVTDVKKDGYTDSSQRIDITAPADLNSLRSDLTKVQTVTATATDSEIVLGGVSINKKAFVFGVIKYPNGAKKAVAGSQLRAAKAAASSGITTELEISIPADSVPAGTTSLTGKFKSFDPSKADDAKYFPGAYMDSNGNKLVSLGFDYVNITDNNGSNLGKSIAKAKAAGFLKAASQQATPTVITRSIYPSICESILRDEDLSKSGYQISVWVYNSSKGYWDFVGQGTVVDYYGHTVEPFNISGCQNENYYLRIEVTNDYFASYHWNLDQAIVNSLNKEVCVSVNLKDQSENPVSNSILSLQDDDSKNSFATVSGVVDSGYGKYKISTIMTDETDADRTATLSYYDPLTYEEGTQVVLLGDSPDCTSVDIVLTRPKTCQVEGKVVDENGQGKDAQDIRLYGFTSKYNYFNNSVKTNNDGTFYADVFCGMDVNVNVNSSNRAVFNVNDSTSDFPAYEASDVHDKVLLKDIVMREAYQGTLTLNGATFSDQPNKADSFLKYDFRGNTNIGNSYVYLLFNQDGECTAGTSGCFQDAFAIYIVSHTGTVTPGSLTTGTYPIGFCPSETSGKGVWVQTTYSTSTDYTANVFNRKYNTYGAGCDDIVGTFGSGSVTITELSDRIKGNFDFTVMEAVDWGYTPIDGGAIKTISGSFDVPKI